VDELQAPPMNLRQIEIFRAIMLTGSVSSAGRLLSVSQPAVSRVLRQTEDRLKIQLFIRRATGLQPTPEALRLYTEIELVYRGVQRVEALAKDLVRVKTGLLRVISTPSVGHSLIPRAIGEFRALYPGVRVVFDALLHQELVDAVARNQCEVGISLIQTDHPSLESSLLGESRLVCICHRDNPLAALDEVSIKDLLGQPMILQTQDSPIGTVIRQYLARGEEQPDVVCEIRINWIACSLAQARVGIAIVDELSVDLSMWPNIVSVPLVGQPALRYHLLTAINHPASVVTQSFIARLRGLIEGAEKRIGRSAGGK
jgi:DNA-binding transcriptional LysR family regulator